MSKKSNPLSEQNRLAIRIWLYTICVLVAAMVIVGGATRLTDSGLSITEWKPLLGIIPPLSHEMWLEEFQKYQQIPQYKLLNKGMNLAEFQFIYWWEWSHRFLGRFVGFVFVIPLLWFWLTGRLDNYLKPRLLLLLFLGGFQGFIGWWMVSSGLVERTDVSQYRLAVHLIVAFVIFAYALWLSRGLLNEQHKDAKDYTSSGLAPAITLAILIQVFLGALVAGLNAGLAFNDWPLMDGAIIPDSLLIENPWWINFFENIKTVQFTHRMFAYALIILIIYNFFRSISGTDDKAQKIRAVLLLLLSLFQAALGIITLVLQVPLDWALFHQAGAVIFLGYAVIYWRGYKPGYSASSTG